mmetsp:Transcript_25794/g.60471  ORF Transcript_25794/g.60471 Transcript_25794/m.60471 type:complete len:461 (+) Transcript_25794:100-1482(+)
MKMKVPVDNDVEVGSERRCDDTSSINNTRDGTANTQTIDFDDWAEDPFMLEKESDVFSSFTGVEEVVHENSNANPASFPPSSSGSVLEKGPIAVTKVDPIKNSAGDSPSRKRGRFRKSSNEETCSRSGTGLNSKNLSSTKKKTDYIPISRRKKKPKGMPKRPLSAYNLFFQAERTKIIANQQEGNGPRIGFEGLGKIIGKQWRDLSSADKKDYEKLAEKDSERYRKEMDAYHEMKANRFAEEERRAAEQTPVLSGTSSLTNSIQASSFDSNFVKQQGYIRVVPVGEVFGNPLLFSHPPKSMFSSISSLPLRTASTPYHPIHRDQSPSPTMHTLQQGNSLSSRSAANGIHGPPPPNYFPQHAPYDGVALGPGAAMGATTSRGNSCPMPPGMEVLLSDHNGVDRRYRVQYTCYSMTRENANKYIESVTGVNANAISTSPELPPPPVAGPVPGSNREYDGWRV